MTMVSDMKTCGCGKNWGKLPNLTPWIRRNGELLGYLFNCDCGSTLFLKASEYEERTKERVPMPDMQPEKATRKLC